MRIKQAVRRLFVAIAVIAAVAGGAMAVTASPAMAGTSCKTVHLTGDWWVPTINPRMDVSICYNGSSVWQSGPVTPGVGTAGYYVTGFDWYGTYGGGSWLGVGENFLATAWTNVASFYCTPRWTINTWGNVTSYSRNC